MLLSQKQANQYLERIGYSGDLNPTLHTLKALQKTHLFHVPFENLDIHYGTPIELNIERVFQKIVLNKRGGFCYELNGLFHELLRFIGFEVKRISARVYDKEKGYGFEFDHLVNIVRIGESDWLADVGFGDFTHAPLELKTDIIQTDERGEFFIQKSNDGIFTVFKNGETGPVPQYLFTEIPREYSDYSGMCHYHQTSPDSHFTRKKMITIPSERGRITLTSEKLKITESGFSNEFLIRNEAEFEEKLRQYFGIKI